LELLLDEGDWSASRPRRFTQEGKLASII